jgi:hypothetical protein
MQKQLIIAMAVLAANGLAIAAEPDDVSEQQPAPVTDAPATPDQPKTLSGMSILGNEEAPKSLVIIPWKSSELGDTIALSDTLDERARPVDKDVFLRELNYYEIRSGKK